MTEQMSFLVPSESEQIQIIDSLEAERAQAPSAFFVPQEVIDEFLRNGSNTPDHRMAVAADFSKQFPTETIALRLPRIYQIVREINNRFSAQMMEATGGDTENKKGPVKNRTHYDL